MPGKPTSTVPLARPLRDALADNAALARLSERLRESNARFETVRGLLPEGLRAAVKPGPLDEEGWSLLAANAAVAAKLRQLLPRLRHELTAAGWPERPIRLKVLSG
jgi:hypothetical protein